MADCKRNIFDRQIKKGAHGGGELKAGELLQQVGEGLLQDIKVILLVTGKSPGQMVNPVAVSVVKGLKGFLIALVRQLNRFSSDSIESRMPKNDEHFP